MSLNQKEILLVDDDGDLRRLARKVLEAAGIAVVESATVKDAIMHIDERMPHLVLLDLNMPGESGFDFLETRRSHASLRQVPVIVLSGLRDKQSIHRAMSLGASDYIAKPLNASLLLQKIRKLFHSEKNQNKVVFDAQRRPQIQVLLPVKILAASETGFQVQMPAKILGQTEFSLRSPLLDLLGTSGARICPSSRVPLAVPDQPGQYQSELRYVELDESAVVKMREIIKSWK